MNMQDVFVRGDTSWLITFWERSCRTRWETRFRRTFFVPRFAFRTRTNLQQSLNIHTSGLITQLFRTQSLNYSWLKLLYASILQQFLNIHNYIYVNLYLFTQQFITQTIIRISSRNSQHSYLPSISIYSLNNNS